MKNIFNYYFTAIILLPTIFLNFGINSHSADFYNYHVYDFLRYKVVGGPALDLKISPTDDPSVLQIDLIKHRLIEEPIQFPFDKTESNAHLFELYYQALRNELPMSTPGKKTISRPTGSWHYIYLVKEGREVQLKDDIIKMSLSILMNIILDEFEER